MEIKKNGLLKVKMSGLIKVKDNGLVNKLIISYKKERPTSIERKITLINKTMDLKTIHNKTNIKTIQNFNLATINQMERANNLDIRNGHDKA